MTRKKIAQANEITYELHTLGWKAFQQLCVSVVSDYWGQTVEGYWDSNDGGRDGGFFGKWKSKDGEMFEGSFTVQCKFSAKPDGTLHISQLKDELVKAEKLAKRGLADNYFLLSSKRLTGISAEKIKNKFEAIPGLNKCSIYGSDRISQFIRESPHLRRLVPHVYGLGDLSEILDQRAYGQSQEILSALGDDLAKFVVTDAYRSSLRAISKQGFVLLLGEPTCGKSTIAAALALGALDQGGYSTLKVRDANDFVSHSNPNEAKQFFWVDDAFGPTQFDWHKTTDWSQAFPHVNSAIRRGAQVVFTSRDYIYSSAKRVLKSSALPVINESQVVINVESLSQTEREQILYNHIRLGEQPKSFKTLLKPYLHEVASAEGFSPEIARRLGHPAFTRKLHVSSTSLKRFVSEPMELLIEILRTLDPNSRSAIALVFMRGGALESPVTLSKNEEHAIALMGGTNAEVRSSLTALKGSLVNQVRQGETVSWRFKHPTIRDAFASLVADDNELMDIYLAGTPAETLFGEITCGDVGLDGVKVIVPHSRYRTVLDRFEKFVADDSQNKRIAYSFLARRCDRKFLAELLEQKRDFLSTLTVAAYLYAISDVGVIVRLNQFELLPEPERLKHVEEIKNLAVQIPDAGFLDSDIRSLFKNEEMNEILDEIRDALLPELNSRVSEWKESWDGEEDPDIYFDELLSALKKFEDEFSDDAESLDQIVEGIDAIAEAIAEMPTAVSDMPDDNREFGSSQGDDESGGVRSIFDDVDQ